MLYVIRHSPTGTLLACVQRNGYQLAYYGLLLFDQQPTSVQIAEALAEAGVEPGDPANTIADWIPLPLTEHEVKMANVKLRNDPSRVVAYREGVMSSK